MKVIFTSMLLFLTFIGIASVNPIHKEYFVDTTTALSVYNLLSEKQFRSIENGFVNEKNKKHALWLKVTSPQTNKGDIFIFLTNAHLDTVETFSFINDSLIKHQLSGDHMPFTTRGIETNYFGFVFPANADAFYIRLRGNGTLASPVLSYSREGYTSYLASYYSLLYFYLGVVLIAIVLNLYLFIRLKDGLYWHYIVGIMGFLIFTLIDKGLLFQYIWPNSPFFNTHAMIFYNLAYVLFFVLAINFFDIRLKHNYKLTFVFISIGIVIATSILFDLCGNYTYSMNIFMSLALVLPVLFILLGIKYFIAERKRTYLFYSIAWFIFWLVGNIYNLAYIGVIRMNFYIDHSVQIAHIADIILLFVAVIDRIHLLKEDRLAAREELVQAIQEKKNILENQAEYLEKLVQVRTRELKEKSEEVLVQNEELETQREELYSKTNELEKTILELKRTQASLIETEKMASLGILTAGVAHEINNPLNYIMGAHSGLENFFLNSEIQKNEEVEFHLSSIKTGIERVAGIVKGLNQFSRKGDNLNEPCNLHAIIDNCLLMIKNQTKHRVRIKKDYNSKSIQLLGNVGKMHQVFLNLLSNAAQAIDGLGQISIITNLGDDFCEVIIEDTGCGISKENLNKITDPFFTTKEPGMGTGLGLYIAHGIVKDHGGSLRFESEMSSGTKVFISFPLIQD